MDFRSYILENKFKITIFENKINIINYLEIDAFDENKIVVRYKEGVVVISGYNLTISKLLDDELLISGEILKVEFR